eukprot:8569686-Pyramimonas_sp.AAC.1
MNSTYRGAVEVCNLCCNLDQSDLLKAECIRTFQEHTIDGRAWMNRLGTFQNSSQMKDRSVTTYVPPARKPHVRTDRSR